MSKPGKVLKGLCKKLGVRLTVKRGKKRVYKSVKVLKEQCKRKKKKKKRKRRRKRRFGTHHNQNGTGETNDLFIDGDDEKIYIEGVLGDNNEFISGDMYWYEKFGDSIPIGEDDEISCYVFRHFHKATAVTPSPGILQERISIPHNSDGHTADSNPALSKFYYYKLRRNRTGSHIGKKRKRKKVKRKRKKKKLKKK